MTDTALARLRKAVESGASLDGLLALANKAASENPAAVAEIMRKWKMGKSTPTQPKAEGEMP